MPPWGPAAVLTKTRQHGRVLNVWRGEWKAPEAGLCLHFGAKTYHFLTCLCTPTSPLHTVPAKVRPGTGILPYPMST